MSTHLNCPRCGVAFPALTPAMFSFNSPHGMCPECSGLGTQRGLDPDRLVADAGKSVLDGALELYGDVNTPHVRHILEGLAEHYGFDLGTPWFDLPERVHEVILYGSDEEIAFSYQTQSGKPFEYTKRFEGLVPASQRRYRDSQSSAEGLLDRFFAPLQCPEMWRRPAAAESRSVLLGGPSIAESRGAVTGAIQFFHDLGLRGRCELYSELLRRDQLALAFMSSGVGY